MKKLDRVKQILTESVNGADLDTHGRFWQNLDLEHFKTHEVFGLRIAVPGDVDASYLVRALRGLEPFGADVGTPNASYSRMPAGLPPVPDDKIQFIADWIQTGCRDEEWTPPTEPPSGSPAKDS